MGQFRRRHAIAHLDVRRDLPREQLDLHLRRRLPRGPHRALTRTGAGLLQLRCALHRREGPSARGTRGPPTHRRPVAIQVQGAKNGTTRVKKNGEIVTAWCRTRASSSTGPDFPRGPGCALHVMAMDNDGELHPAQARSLLATTPSPRRRESWTNGHVMTRIAQWDRQHWGAGGDEFHWWCTEDPAAFVGATRVVDSMSEELIAIVGPQRRTSTLLAYMDQRLARGARHAAPPPGTATTDLALGGEWVLFSERRCEAANQGSRRSGPLRRGTTRVNVLGRRTAFDARRRSRSGRALEFASFNKPTVAALFHVNSSLAAVHNWRRPQAQHN